MAIPLHREHFLTFFVATDLHFDPYLKSCHKGALGQAITAIITIFAMFAMNAQFFWFIFALFFVEYPINMSSENGTKDMAL